MSEKSERLKAFLSSLTEETAPGMAPLLGWYWAATGDSASVVQFLTRMDWEQSIQEAAEGIEDDLYVWTTSDEEMAAAIHWAQGFDYVLQCLEITSPRWDEVKEKISQEEIRRGSEVDCRLQAYYAALPPVTGERLTLNIVD